MNQYIEPFLPPQDCPKKGSRNGISSIRCWLICLTVIGGGKIYYGSHLSIRMGGAPLHAATPPTAQSDVPKEKDKASQGNPMVIGLNEVQVLQKLRERRVEIESSSEAQEKKKEEMKIINDIMQKNIQELTQLKNTLDTQSKSLQKEPIEALKKMAKLYEGMKPAQAAKILESMDTQVVSQLVSCMKKQIAAGVVASLSEKKAREVTLQTLKSKPIN